MKLRSAIKSNLFADEQHRKKIDRLGDSLAEIESPLPLRANYSVAKAEDTKLGE